METLWVGIDVGKDSMVVAATQGEETLELGELNNNRRSFAALADLLEEAKTRPS